jgi:hypothetical protein
MINRPEDRLMVEHTDRKIERMRTVGKKRVCTSMKVNTQDTRYKKGGRKLNVRLERGGAGVGCGGGYHRHLDLLHLGHDHPRRQSHLLVHH